jgi:SAM-dependent methyltransferase
MKINYRPTRNAWFEYPTFIKEWIERTNPDAICDIGGGANPLLDLDFVNSRKIQYTVLDISRSELEKAPRHYEKEVQDIEAPDFIIRERFDFAFSKAMAEHIKNGKLFHQNVFQMLKPGGIAIHYFPTLYAFPFVVNKLFPESLSSALLDIFAPRDKYKQAKFPAYYNWCFGPTPAMLAMLQSVGFEVLEFNALIGNIYYDKVPIARTLQRIYSEFLLQHPNPYLTSFAQIVLKKNDPG